MAEKVNNLPMHPKSQSTVDLLVSDSDSMESLPGGNVLPTFLERDFKVEEHLQKKLKSHSLYQQGDVAIANDRYVGKLDNSLEFVNDRIRFYVSTHSAALTNQQIQVVKLNKQVEECRESVKQILIGVNNLEGGLCKKITEVENNSYELRNIQSTLQVIRKVEYFLKLCEKAKDETKALRLVENILDSNVFQGIEIVQQKKSEMYSLGKSIRKMASEKFKLGLSKSVDDLETSLQIFFDLEMLDEVISKFFSETMDSVCEKIRSLIAVQETSITEFSKIVSRIFSFVREAFSRTCDLISSLENTKEKLTQRFFLFCINQKRILEVINHFDGTVKIRGAMKSRIIHEIGQSLDEVKKSPIKKIYIDCYPELLNIIQLFDKNMTSLNDENDSKAEFYLSEFEQGYLQQSISMMFQNCKAIFDHVQKPNEDGKFHGISENHIITLTSSIERQLDRVVPHATLTLKIGEQIGKIIQIFVTQIEQKKVRNREALHPNISKFPNSLELFNANLYNSLTKLFQEINRFGPKYSTNLPVNEILDKSIENLKKQCNLIIAPLFMELRNQVQEILFSVHYGRSYVEQLHSTLEYFKKNHLRLFRNTELLNSLCKRTAEDLINYYLLHISLRNPLSEEEKTQLAGSDIAQIEYAINEHLFHVDKLAKSSKSMKLFRKLLCMPSDQIKATNFDALNPIYLVHHLFSRLPPKTTGDPAFSLHAKMNVDLETYGEFLNSNLEQNPRKVHEFLDQSIKDCKAIQFPESESEEASRIIELLEWNFSKLNAE